MKNVLMIKETGNFLWSKRLKNFFPSLYSLYKKVGGAYLAGKPYPSVLRNPFPSSSLSQNEETNPSCETSTPNQGIKMALWLV